MSSILINQQIGKRNKNKFTFLKKNGFTTLIIMGLIVSPLLFLTGFKEPINKELLIPPEFNADTLLYNYYTH